MTDRPPVGLRIAQPQQNQAPSEGAALWDRYGAYVKWAAVFIAIGIGYAELRMTVASQGKDLVSEIEDRKKAISKVEEDIRAGGRDRAKLSEGHVAQEAELRSQRRFQVRQRDNFDAQLEQLRRQIERMQDWHLRKDSQFLLPGDLDLLDELPPPG